MYRYEETVAETEPEIAGEVFDELTDEMDAPFSEVEEMELAAELLAVNSEEELDQFIGKLLKKAWRGVRKIARPFGSVLKSVAKKALPFVGGALGSFIPIPGVGAAVGTALGSAVGNALEAEFEGLDSEDQEYEMARRFVRIAGTAAQQLADSPAAAGSPEAMQSAILNATRRHAPRGAGQGGARRRSGRWMRRGNTIVVLGV